MMEENRIYAKPDAVVIEDSALLSRYKANLALMNDPSKKDEFVKVNNEFVELARSIIQTNNVVAILVVSHQDQPDSEALICLEFPIHKYPGLMYSVQREESGAFYLTEPVEETV